MAQITIYHNPRCAKSRQAVKFLEEKDEDFEIIHYLDGSLSAKKLFCIVEQLGIKPFDLLRHNESIFKEKFKDKNLSDQAWIDAMLKYPRLIERPIVVKNGKAVIGRPTEKILDIL